MERLFYSEALRCQDCGNRVRIRRSASVKHFRYVKCPRCHSVDLTVLRRRDGIDRMQRGPLNLLYKLVGGKLYHCWFCRLQFYDPRQRYNAAAAPQHAADSDEPESNLRAVS